MYNFFIIIFQDKLFAAGGGPDSYVRIWDISNTLATTRVLGTTCTPPSDAEFTLGYGTAAVATANRSASVL